MAAFDEFALQAGPPAIAKMEEICKVAKDAWPKRIKLDFRRADCKDTAVWLPAKESLHEVFFRYKPNMHDFVLKYVDKEGDEVMLNPSRHGVEEMCENVDGHTVRLIVEWRPASPVEMAHLCAPKETELTSHTTSTTTSPLGARAGLEKAKLSISGGGKISDKDVLAAEKAVEKAGGRVMASKGKVGFVQKHGCDLESWADVCEQIQMELHLSDSEVAALKSAEHSDECDSFILEDFPTDTQLSTRVMAYQTVRDHPNNKIDVIYGRHELSVQVPFEPIGIPLDRCVRLGNRIFAALPAVSPHFNKETSEMKDNPFVVPSGWTLVAADDKNVTAILRDVVGSYFWGTTVITLKGSGQQPWKGFYPATQGDNAGKSFGEVKYLTDLGEGKYVFTSSSYRMLVEAVPTQSAPQLTSAWKRYVRTRAQADWGSRLCLQAEDGDEA